MRKYRIVGSGNPKYPYVIQIKTIFFWHNYYYWDWNIGDYCQKAFRTLPEAMDYLKSLQTCKYWGDKLEND